MVFAFSSTVGAFTRFTQLMLPRSDTYSTDLKSRIVLRYVLSIQSENKKHRSFTLLALYHRPKGRSFTAKNDKQPHIHAKYAEHNISISIPNGEVLEGKLPSKKLKILQAWIAIHEDELMADWELAVNGENPYKIEPLR